MKKDKERKGHESTIGKIIYGFMLFAPLLAILTTCLYTTFNKNAYLSYTSNSKIQETTTTGTINYETGKTYKIKYTENTNTANWGFQVNSYTDVLFNGEELSNYYSNSLLSNIRVITLYGQNKLLALTENGAFIEYANTNWGEITTIEFIFNPLENYGNYKTFNNTTSKAAELIQLDLITPKLSETFYNSINEVEKSNLFNWSKNSIIYTGIQATCETLSINNTFMPMLLSYWLIMSILYFLYDIILMILQILHKKIHELQDSF